MRESEVVTELDTWIRSHWADADIDHWHDDVRLVYMWRVDLDDRSRPRLGISLECIEDHSGDEIRRMLEGNGWMQSLHQLGDRTALLKTNGELVRLEGE